MLDKPSPSNNSSSKPSSFISWVLTCFMIWDCLGETEDTGLSDVTVVCITDTLQRLKLLSTSCESSFLVSADLEEDADESTSWQWEEYIGPRSVKSLAYWCVANSVESPLTEEEVDPAFTSVRLVSRRVFCGLTIAWEKIWTCECFWHGMERKDRENIIHQLDEVSRVCLFRPSWAQWNEYCATVDRYAVLLS